tara:strand:+ start:3553 stop:3741 length:189 start_codon:yes stop_codon:yes gene_type:complete
MALALQAHELDMQLVQDRMRRQLSLRFRDYGVVVRVRHLDGRTFPQAESDKRPRTANPNGLR